MGRSAHIRARRRRRARLSGRLGEEQVARRAARDAQKHLGKFQFLETKSYNARFAQAGREQIAANVLKKVKP